MLSGSRLYRLLSFVASCSLCFRRASTSTSPSTTPHAFSVSPSTIWHGDDGQWSALTIQVGSPPQWIDVLVSTAISETWAVGPGGCDGTSICQSKRGGLFDYQKSSTWQNQGLFALGPDFTGDALYGLDVLQFGPGGASLNNSIIGSVNTTSYWVGFLGLGNVPGSFNNVVVPGPIGSLANSSIIPSQSYGFTAGAIYQQKGNPASLTLGGYDANRFIPHDITFQLNALKQPTVFLNSISVGSLSPAGKAKTWSSNPLELLSKLNGVYVTIDSSTPFLTLPKSTCDSFAEALGLTYNSTLQLYTFEGNASSPDDLRSWNLNFTFVLSDVDSPSQVVNITLPYAALDLQLSYPYILSSNYQDPSKSYFPLRQGLNDTEYVIGRAFLQEAYIIADYDRNNFSIYQAVHNSNSLVNISLVDIQKPTSTNITPTPAPQSAKSGGFSTPAIIGIVVGGVVVLSVVIILILYLRRRRPDAEAKEPFNLDKKSPPPFAPADPSVSLFGKDAPPSEMDNTEVFPTSERTRVITVSEGMQELPAPVTPLLPVGELPANSVHTPGGRSRGDDQKFLGHSGMSPESHHKFRSSMRVRHDASAGEASSS